MGKKEQKRIDLAEDTLSKRDIAIKIKRLEGYIKKTERRMEAHEKKLVLLREEHKKDVEKLAKELKSLGDKLKVSV